MPAPLKVTRLKNTELDSLVVGIAILYKILEERPVFQQ